MEAIPPSLREGIKCIGLAALPWPPLEMIMFYYWNVCHMLAVIATMSDPKLISSIPLIKNV